jgi:hypothetical protein
VPAYRSWAAAVLRDPVISILILAGVFDWLSGNPVHSLLLLATAVALAIDAGPGRSAPMVPATDSPGTVVGARSWTPVVVAGALVASVLIGGFARYSSPATVAVLVPGVVALTLAWRGPLHARPEPKALEPLGVVAWASLFVGLAIWELTSLLLQPSFTTDSYAHPTISVVMDPILAHHPGRTVTLFVWLLGGWFLVQR